MDKIQRALRPDGQAFDEVRITTVPRYKTSGLSGDEWRISARIELLRKGRKVAEKFVRDVAVACGVLPAFYYESIDNGLGYFAGEEELCDQEGCSERGTVLYRVKKEFSRDNPHEWNKEREGMFVAHRLFCQRHSKRGDCGFDDSDANYELVSGGIQNPSEEDVSPSVFGGIISPSGLI